MIQEKLHQQVIFWWCHSCPWPCMISPAPWESQPVVGICELMYMQKGIRHVLSCLQLHEKQFDKMWWQGCKWPRARESAWWPSPSCFLLAQQEEPAKGQTGWNKHFEWNWGLKGQRMAKAWQKWDVLHEVRSSALSSPLTFSTNLNGTTSSVFLFHPKLTECTTMFMNTPKHK